MIEKRYSFRYLLHLKEHFKDTVKNGASVRDRYWKTGSVDMVDGEQFWSMLEDCGKMIDVLIKREREEMRGNDKGGDGNMKASLIRLARILIAQVISFSVAETMGIDIPYLNMSVGALINAGAKYLRNKFGWTWLPV